MYHAPTAVELLEVWERGRSQPPVDRALALLALTDSSASLEQLADLRIGQRDARLLELREKIFGPRVAGQTHCPGCGQSVELNFAVAEIHSPAPVEAGDSFAAKFSDHEIVFRLPTSRDLGMLSPTAEIGSSRNRLLQSCILDVRHHGQPTSVAELPNEVVTALSERFAELDPQGDIQIALSCPHCQTRWNAPFDIVSFLWTEINAWAVRLLREVHVLASAYGWRETDILGLSPGRRQLYLEMIEQ